jgi:hypothetical protein
MEFLRVRLRTSPVSFLDLVEFYGLQLGLERIDDGGFVIGSSELELVPRGGEPFYHFALLVPGDRFDTAVEWTRALVDLLPEPETGAEVFAFPAWNAQAIYFHDPAGNIVELIAHRDIGETGTEGPFASSELLGFSEVSLVGDPATMARGLEQLRLHLWDGTLEKPGRLAFVGERGRTLILCPEGRGWLPTGRGAEPYSVEALLSGEPAGEVAVNGHRITRTGSPPPSRRLS